MGIYIHIPFCKKACSYCNFHFSTNQSLKQAFLQALQKEIILTAQTTADTQDVATLYFGGGTPSLLNPEELAAIINDIRKHFSVLPNAEITLEANPDDINPQSLTSWQEIGINRLSVGLQSFNEAELQWMNRAHNSTEAMSCLASIPQSGFSNYSIDLIYGSPMLTHETWQQHIETIIAHKVPHISCYALTVEPKTALHYQIEKKQTLAIDEQQQAEQYDLLCTTLENAGYEHYETSNFALPHYNSKHNSSYWESKFYIGLGPSAHSYNGSNKRHWNIANNALYIQQLEMGQSPIEATEELDTTTQMNEAIMIGLRLKKGLDLNWFENSFRQKHSLLAVAKKYLDMGKLVVENDHLCATKNGRFFIDGIAADLFF